MDPNQVQAFGHYDAKAALSSAVGNLAPLATTWHGVQDGPAAVYAAPRPASQGVLPAFWGKLESVGKEVGHLAVGAGSFLEHTAVDAVKAPYQFGEGLAKTVLNYNQANGYQQQSQHLSQQLDSLMSDYKSGRVSKSAYLQGIKQFNQDSLNLQHSLSNFQSQTSIDEKNAVKAAVNTAADMATIFSLGSAAAKMTAEQTLAMQKLTSIAQLTKNAETIAGLATNKNDWKLISPLTQNAIKLATSQALAVAGKQATAQQIARAAAVNLLLKFPLNYNALDGTANQLYDELNSDKYGDAVKTTAFNAALLLSGGPIGWGLKQAGKLAKGFSVGAGLRPGSMLDELSSRVHNKDRRALARIAQNAIKNGNEEDVKSMIVGLESNLRRANGNQAQAVNFIQDHLENYVSWGSLQHLTHQEFWDNFVSYWKHAEGLQRLKGEGLIAGVAHDDPRAIVPGRFSTQDKIAIAAAVTRDMKDILEGSGTTTKAVPVDEAQVKSYMETFNTDEATARAELSQQTVQSDLPSTATGTVESRLAAWEAFKQQHPNAAFANNPNIDRQIKQLISTIKDPEALSKAINRIPTELGVEGIPKLYAEKMAKDGYIAIIPKSHNVPAVPFQETSGKLATVGAEGDFFTKAAAPVPVLRSVGTFLTNLGLSPEVAQQRVNDVFRTAFSARLAEAGVKRMAGDSKEDAAKNLIQQLSNYMKNPSGGLSIAGHVLPLTDMRQLTKGDILRAVPGINKSDAKAIQEAILQAHIDVPWKVQGLGDRIMDLSYKINPAAGIYSRVQGAFRFAWNPVFEQGKLPIKAEILAQMQTGGKFPMVAGTNTFLKLFFPGQYKEIDGIVHDTRFRELMPGGLGGEAANSAGFAERAAHYNKNTLRPVAGLVKSMAERMQMSTGDYIAQYPEQVTDAATALLHYDRNASFLNSPLARTLNIAFFPFRFNVKVTGYMAKFLAKQDPIVQYAAVKGIMDAHKFLNSPQGQAWYSQNSDVIGLFKYFSPLETISVISNALGLKHDSVAQYGELGGLPFGWIPMMLDSVGLTHFGQAYVDPKTGAIAKDYVPTSLYGAANAAIQDLLSSLFTWPGATAGLPNKGSLERKAIGVLPGSKDFKTQDPTNVTPQEQSFSNTVKGLNPAAQPALPKSSGDQRVPGTAVPKQYSAYDVRNPNKRISAAKSGGSGSGSKKKKKADFTPGLLPGQGSLGQL